MVPEEIKMEAQIVCQNVQNLIYMPTIRYNKFTLHIDAHHNISHSVVTTRMNIPSMIDVKLCVVSCGR